MAQLAASIVSHDEEFKRQVATLLRSCGVQVGIVEERRPGVETAPWNARLMQLTDPFGNRLRFNQDLK